MTCLHRCAVGWLSPETFAQFAELELCELYECTCALFPALKKGDGRRSASDRGRHVAHDVPSPMRRRLAVARNVRTIRRIGIVRIVRMVLIFGLWNVFVFSDWLQSGCGFRSRSDAR